MKRYIIRQAACLWLLSMAACKKTEIHPVPLASLNVISAQVNQPAVKVKFQGVDQSVYFSALSALSYGTNRSFGLAAGQGVPVVIATDADTTKSLFSANLHFNNGDVYSLYLAGQAGALDTLLVKETIPAFKDSLFAIRFINLSYNSEPVSTNLAGSPPGSEAGSLPYKSYSTFKTYAAGLTNTSYTFEIRAAATGNLLGTYTFKTTAPANPVPRFKSCTLAWIGQTGATGTFAPKIQRINNY